MALEKTLCILKPDAVSAGNTGNIIAHIQKEGFRMLFRPAGTDYGVFPNTSLTARESWYKDFKNRKMAVGALLAAPLRLLNRLQEVVCGPLGNRAGIGSMVAEGSRTHSRNVTPVVNR